jgi:chromate transporter
MSSEDQARPGSAYEVFLAALKLGLVSFGGPIAHLAYFERVYVRQRRWLGAQAYAQIVALCQILPGPASSQTGFLIGLHRAGWPGALAAWLGFTLPSALLMFACAALVPWAHGPLAQAVMHGLKLAAVPIVAQAAWSMARRLCPDRRRALIGLAAASLLLTTGGAASQLLALVAGAAAGLILCRDAGTTTGLPPLPVSSRLAWLALGLFVLLLFVLPLAATNASRGPTALAAIFYRSGALVFGGGHVVLPLLRDALVPAGWIADDRFLAGYGAAQAMPGPMFAFSAYLGAASAPPGAAPLWAALAVAFIFLPGLLAAVAGAALWDRAARHPQVPAALAGINAAVVGILGAALYDPVARSAVHGVNDVAVALFGLALLLRWNTSPLLVVLACTGLSLLPELI